MEHFNERPAQQEKKEGERYELLTRNGNVITVEESEPGKYEVVDSNVFNDEIQKIGFTGWDGSVENLDTDSDVFLSFKESQHLRWEDVELLPEEFRSPSQNRLQEALKHVDVETSGELEV